MFLARQLEGSVARRLGGAHGSAARRLGSFRLDETKARIVETTGRRAILVAVRDDALNASLVELGRLAGTLGIKVVDHVLQRRGEKAGNLGSGKLAELMKTLGTAEDAEEEEEEEEERPRRGRRDEAEREPRADLVIVDAELGPRQISRLATALGCEVTDRTGVILDIFQKHARSKEARLEVELARLKVLAPRLREGGAGSSERQSGKGLGESTLSLDKRANRDRIAEINAELLKIEKAERQRAVERSSDSLRVALVGYTNAGKSSWMRQLTSAGVLVEDKLFATLDTTVRSLQPPVTPPILVSDTVGFIQNLPHGLVRSFRSTLDEAKSASLLLHVVDASDAACERHIEVAHQALEEIGALRGRKLLVFNKADRCSEARAAELAAAHPEAVFVCAHDEADVKRLRAVIRDDLDRHVLQTLQIFVRYDQSELFGDVHKSARIVSEQHQGGGVQFELRLHPRDRVRLAERARRT